MERLTGRKEGGNAYIVGCPSFEIPKIIGLIIQNVVDRLAAYEDTGLEPENIKRDFNEDAVLKLAGQALGVPPDRLRELAQADQEGQMVTQLNCPRKSDKSPLLIKQKCKEYIMNYCPNCNARTTIAHLITPAMLREAKVD